MTGPPIANALASGLKAYEAGAVVDLVTYHKAKWARVLCGGFALLGRLQEIGSCSRSPLTRAHAHREIPSRVPFLGYDFQFDAPPAALSVLLCQLPPGFSGVMSVGQSTGDQWRVRRNCESFHLVVVDESHEHASRLVRLLRLVSLPIRQALSLVSLVGANPRWPAICVAAWR